MTIAGPLSARHPLARAACLALLEPGGHGRIAASMRAVPVIIPVTFTLVGDDVVFDPGSGERVSAAIANCVVAFETDQIGAAGHREWDVHVTGVAREVHRQGPSPLFRLSAEMIAGWQAGT